MTRQSNRRRPVGTTSQLPSSFALLCVAHWAGQVEVFPFEIESITSDLTEIIIIALGQAQ